MHTTRINAQKSIHHKTSMQKKLDIHVAYANTHSSIYAYAHMRAQSHAQKHAQTRYTSINRNLLYMGIVDR